MEKALKNLSAEEREELFLIPVWICILIAGADNHIDQREIKKSIKIIKLEKKTVLVDYYKEVARKFEVNLKGYIALMPKEKDLRIDFLLKKLKRADYLFSFLENEFAHQLYWSFRDFANRVAHASGGFFGLLSVSFAESNFIDLKMIAEPPKQKML